MKAALIALILGCMFTFVLGSPANTHAFVITLDPENTGILYPTNGMVLRPFLDPPDERLGQAVLQLTYELNGVRDLFDLVGITVATGSLNVGIQYEDGTIAVYNDLTAGAWPLSDGARINRVTLECPSGGSCPSTEALREMFRVQSLEIETLPKPVSKGTYCCKEWEQDKAKSAERNATVENGKGCKAINDTAQDKNSCTDGNLLGEGIKGAAQTCSGERLQGAAGGAQVQGCTRE